MAKCQNKPLLDEELVGRDNGKLAETVKVFCRFNFFLVCFTRPAFALMGAFFSFQSRGRRDRNGVVALPDGVSFHLK